MSDTLWLQNGFITEFLANLSAVLSLQLNTCPWWHVCQCLVIHPTFSTSYWFTVNKYIGIITLPSAIFEIDHTAHYLPLTSLSCVTKDNLPFISRNTCHFSHVLRHLSSGSGYLLSVSCVTWHLALRIWSPLLLSVFCSNLTLELLVCCPTSHWQASGAYLSLAESQYTGLWLVDTWSPCHYWLVCCEAL